MHMICFRKSMRHRKRRMESGKNSLPDFGESVVPVSGHDCMMRGLCGRGRKWHSFLLFVDETATHIRNDRIG